MAVIIDDAEEKLREQKYSFPLPKMEGSHNFYNGAFMRDEALHVHDLWEAGKLESPLMPLRETLIVSEIMDDVRRQLGVRYPSEGPAKAPAQ